MFSQQLERFESLRVNFNCLISFHLLDLQKAAQEQSEHFKFSQNISFDQFVPHAQLVKFQLDFMLFVFRFCALLLKLVEVMVSFQIFVILPRLAFQTVEWVLRRVFAHEHSAVYLMLKLKVLKLNY